MSVGQFLGLRLFLEGVEIPVVSATVQCQKNAPATASIQIPANDYALDLRPRTLVHLFCYDLYNGVPPQEMVSVGGPGVRVQQREQGVDPELEGLFPPERFESTDEQDATDLDNSNWKLLFGGEVVGFHFSKAPGTRAIVLQCLDWSSYWDIAYQYQVSGFSLGGGGIRAAFTGASTSVFNDFLEGSGDVVVNLMSRPPRSYPTLRGTLLGALVHIIEAIGGVYFGRRAVRGVNDFFSLAEMRLHLTQMVGANPYRQTDEVRLLRARGFGSLFRRSLSGLGKLVSVRAVLMALQRYIFHEIIPITTPRYIPPLTDPNLPRYETLGIEEDEETRPIARAASRIKARCQELIDRQQASTDSRQARRQSDRRGGLRVEIRRLNRICQQAARRARRVGLQGGNYTSFSEFFGIPEVSRAFAVASTRFNLVLESTNRGQRPDVRTNTFFPPDSRSAEDVIRLLTAIATDMQQVLDSRHRRRVQRRTSQPDPPPRLITQLYRPDIWMVAPPRCNVIFPELYSSFNYARDFNREVTRLLLRTHSAFFGSDVLFDGFYMAPSRLLGQRRQRQITRGRSSENFDAPVHVVRDLMEHELFTGIIPTFERMSDLNLHALRGGAVEINGTRVGYAQLAANHIFFQYRFKSRQLMYSGKFNPYVAFGFPMLIIDKYLDVDQIRNGEYDHAIAARLALAVREGEGDTRPPQSEFSELREADQARVREIFTELITNRPNTHFLGTPESMTHMVSAQSGGTTQIQMGYARTTNERTEFMGDNVGRSRRVRRTRNVRQSTEVAALEAPRVGSRGFRGGEIVEVTDITDRYTRRQRRLRSTNRTATGQQRYIGGTRLPLYVPDRLFTGRRRRGTTVLVGVEQAAASYGPEVVALVGTGGSSQSSIADANETLVTFRAYRVVEELGVYRRSEQEMAPEDLTFPPWYGEHYRTQNIGGLYSYFFGTGAITDATTFLPPGQRPPANFDGGTISGESPASDRSQAIQFIQRFSQIVAGAVAGEDQPPQPGASSTPEPGGESLGPAGEPADPEVEGALAQVRARSAIGEATEEIVRAYSAVKLGNFDVHQFIRAYTWRPIATMVDLFGTANLEINENGEVVRGVEGFHSRAFGDFDDLRQLVGPGEGNRPQTILGLSTADPDESGDDETASRDQRIAARMDTRKEKRIPVIRYLSALMNQQGIVG